LTNEDEKEEEEDDFPNTANVYACPNISTEVKSPAKEPGTTLGVLPASMSPVAAAAAATVVAESAAPAAAGAGVGKTRFHR